MPHHAPLIATIVAGLVVAFIFGAIAHRIKVSRKTRRVMRTRPLAARSGESTP